MNELFLYTTPIIRGRGGGGEYPNLWLLHGSPESGFSFFKGQYILRVIISFLVQ